MEIEIPWIKDLFIDSNFQIRNTSGFVYNEDANYIWIPDREGSIQQIFKEFLYWFVKFEYPPYVRIQDVRFYSINYARKDKLPNLHAVFLRPYEVHPGFRLCAVRPSVAVSKEGKVYNIKTGSLRTATLSSDSGYWLINLKNPVSDKIETFRLHRLVANAWVLKDQDEEHQEVNHIDGYRANCHCDNLEWCTHRQNMGRFSAEGYAKLTQNCEIRDIVTGKVYKFTSSTDAARFIGIDAKQIQSTYSTRINCLFLNRYEFRYTSHKTEWFYKDDMEVVTSGAARYVFIVTISGRPKRLVFNGQQSFKKYFGIYKWKGKSADSNRELSLAFHKKYPLYGLEIIDRIPSYDVEIKDILTGKVKCYPTASDAAKDIGTTTCMVSRIAKTNGVKQWRQYQIRYAQNKPWPDVKIRSELTYEIVLTHMKTGKRHVFRSQEETAKWLGCSRNSVQNALNRGFFLTFPYTAKLVDKYFHDDVKSRNEAGNSYRVKPGTIRRRRPKVIYRSEATHSS